MAVKTYGKVAFLDKGLFNSKSLWELSEVQPHVRIKLKNVFPKISKTASIFNFDDTPENCSDLLWFLDRYPMRIKAADVRRMKGQRIRHNKTASDLESILFPGYTPQQVSLNEGYAARQYQLLAKEFDIKQKRFLLGDDLGLGKTLTGILTLMNPGKFPAIVCVQSHLPKQWANEGIKKFTNLTTHIVSVTEPYDLPAADVYIIKYSCLLGWVDIFSTGFFKSAIFDEVQELRRCESLRYKAAKVLGDAVEYCIGMSATPIYNYGDEIFNVLDIINPGCLGERYDFYREWTVPVGSGHYKVVDPQALGTYLRDNYLFLRRTRSDVGRELPPLNTIIHTVGFDSNEVKKSNELARQLAMKVISGSFTERGQAARELDSLIRHETGISKAREVAAFVQILLENNEPVLLAGWHRDVYDIWAQELKKFNPVFYTGTESPVQKEKAKQAFIDGETNCFIISLRSGIGLDGLQHRCRTVVIGELDWSPQVHNQVVGRVDRDGNQQQVTVYYLVSEYGSDPFIIDLLGLKSSQAHGIINPLLAVAEQHSDEGRIKLFAESFLNKSVL